jgi:hypothetical protein
MNTIYQHVPAFAWDPRDEVKKADFNTLEELLQVPWVKVWENGFNVKGENIKFSHWALSENNLMAVYGENEAWWVVGYIETLSGIDLPEWEPPKKLLASAK